MTANARFLTESLLSLDLTLLPGRRATPLVRCLAGNHGVGRFTLLPPLRRGGHPPVARSKGPAALRYSEQLAERGEMKTASAKPLDDDRQRPGRGRGVRRADKVHDHD